MSFFRFYLPGIALILAAVVIVAVPEILVAMISVLVLTMGLVALVIGHRIRQSEIKWHTMNEPFQASGWHRYCSFKSDRNML